MLISGIKKACQKSPVLRNSAIASPLILLRHLRQTSVANYTLIMTDAISLSRWRLIHCTQPKLRASSEAGVSSEAGASSEAGVSSEAGASSEAGGKKPNLSALYRRDTNDSENPSVSADRAPKGHFTTSPSQPILLHNFV